MQTVRTQEKILERACEQTKERERLYANNRINVAANN